MNQTHQKLHRHLHPKKILFFMLVPFVLICPLTISSIVLGFPFPYFTNNSALNKFESIYSEVSNVEELEPIGNKFSFITKSKKGVTTCSIFTGQIYKTDSVRERISPQLLSNFSKTAEKYLTDASKYDLIKFAEIKMIPVTIEDKDLGIEYPVNVVKDFGLENYSVEVSDSEKEDETMAENVELNEENQTTNESSTPTINYYLIYLHNTDAFSNLDYRCRSF